MRKLGVRSVSGVLSVAVVLLAGTAAYATDYIWTNADSDNNYMNTNNWITNGVTSVTLPSISGDTAAIDTNGVDKCTVVDGQEAPNINEFRIGYAGNGEFEQTGGTVTATQNSSRYTKIGWNGFDGLYTLSGGASSLNTLRVGAGGGTGTMLIQGGSLTISRAYGDSSIVVGAGSTGLVEMASGSLQTRGGVIINTAGTFSVKGGDPSLIAIGTHLDGDGFWTQNAGGTLMVQIASNGLTPILVDEVDGISGTSWDGIATFALDSELDVSFLDGHMETNFWTVMTAEGGIVDNGLTFAAGVDTNNWNFELVENNTMLVVGYGGATYVAPPAGTNLFASAIVDTPDTWNLYAPEGGNNALSEQSSDGFTVTMAQVTGGNYLYRPVVAQEFGVDKDISEVGQAITISFDVEVLDAVTVASDVDFRFSIYDTNQNCMITSGMIDFGPPAGNTMKIRVEEKVSLSNLISEDPEVYAFVPGEYQGLGGGSSTLGQVSGYPGNGMQYVGEVTHLETTITRTASNEVGVVTLWSDSAGSNTVTCIASINEDAPADPDGMPYSGKYEVFNGFGFKLYDDWPFESATEGRFKVSNYEVSYTAALANGFSYTVSQIVVESSGDVTLSLSDPVVGATYTVRGTDKLTTSMTEIGTYIAVEPGVVVVPAADAGGKSFFDVGLPVVEVAYD
jgi:hypothetical protein